MIPLYYADDTVRLEAEFAQRAMARVNHFSLRNVPHASNQKWRLYHSFLGGVTLSWGGKCSQVRFYFRRFLVELTSVLNSSSEERGWSLGLLPCLGDSMVEHSDWLS